MQGLQLFYALSLCVKHLTLVFLLFALPGCQSGGGVGAAGKVADAALGVIGLKRAEQSPQPRVVSIKLNASPQLNADANGRGLSVVAKLYKLKDANNFMHASQETFQQSSREKEALGPDLVESKEILLIPGQRYSVNEKLGPEVGYIGLVVMYREPDPKHWRLALAQSDITSEGLVFSLRSCALKLESGAKNPNGADISARCNK